MLAALLYGKEDIRVEEVKTPEIKNDEVLIKVKSVSICGSDLRSYKEGLKGVHFRGKVNNPKILGHELSGVISSVGNKVKGFEEGMRVTLAPNIGCGRCDACQKGEQNLCKNVKTFGFSISGAFAEYAVIPAEAIYYGNLVEISDNVSFDEAALTEPLSCVYNGFQHVNIKSSERVLIIGAGPIGIMHAKFAKLAGAVKVYISDISNERLDVCRKIDKSYITINSDDLDEFIMDETKGEGVNVCITACPVAGVQAKSLELTTINGRVLLFGGLPHDNQTVTLNTNLIHYKQLTVLATTGSGVPQFRTTLSFVESGLISVKELITNKFSLKEINKGFEYSLKAKGLKNIISM